MALKKTPLTKQQWQIILTMNSVFGAAIALTNTTIIAKLNQALLSASQFNHWMIVGGVLILLVSAFFIHRSID